jgi:hypothetical protein
MEIDNEDGHLSKRKPEFRYLLLLCLRALLEKLRDVKEETLNEIPRGSEEFEELKLSVQILSELTHIFDNPAGLLQFVLVPSHEHFCVYVAEKYVRMKIPEYGLELNIMGITQNKNLEFVCQCRHSYTGALSDEASKEREIFMRAAYKGTIFARQDAMGGDFQEIHADVPARAQPQPQKDAKVQALETKLQEITNQKEIASGELVILQRDIESSKDLVAEF